MVPVVAVFKEILKKKPDTELYFWCDKKFAPQATKIMQQSFGDQVSVSKISSGKFFKVALEILYAQIYNDVCAALAT